ncbi:HdeD family acid-resistance protein [Sulfurimonas sp.]
MWKWHKNLNLETNLNKNLVDNFKKHAKISGVLFVLFGISGILFPTFMTITTVMLIAYIMLFAGVTSGVLTWRSNREDWVGWLKSFILIMASFFILYYPMQGAAALGLIFAIYFFIDAFASFSLALSMRPQKIWLVWFFNAITSLALGVLFVVGWPMSSLFLIGILVGISLLFDGVALLLGGAFVKDIDENNTGDKDEI